MAEFLVYNKDHWMDSLTQEEIDTQIVKNPDHFMDKYNARYQKGDIVEMRPNGYWTNGTRKGFGNEHFALVVVPTLSDGDAAKYTNAWTRNTVIVESKKDTVNHIYEYICTLNRTSQDDKEFFLTQDFLHSHLLVDITILNQTDIEVSIRLSPLTNPWVKSADEISTMPEKEQENYQTPEQRYDNFIIKEEVINLKKLLKRRKYQMDMAQIILDTNKKAELIQIEDAHITDKSK